MKIVIDYLKDFLKEDFKLLPYLTSIVILIVLFIAHYKFGLYSKLVRVDEIELKLLYSLLFFSVPYFIILKLQLATNNIRLLTKRSVIFFFLVFATLLINQVTKSEIYSLTILISPEPVYTRWLYVMTISLHKFLLLSLPALIYYFVFSDKEVLGFKIKNVNLKIYFYMLAIMLVPIIIASFSDSFMRVYPRYKPGQLEENGLMSQWLSIGVAESFYSLRFIGVELFFRGLMIIGAIRFFGARAILPAAVLYSIWHFGKPMGEAIGAFFGAYILGVLAYRTKSIIGGIIIHLGVALLMEFFAFLQWFKVFV